MLKESHQGDVTGMYDEDPKGNQFKLVMRCDTRTHSSGRQLNNTVNYARPIEDMMGETLGIDGDKILDDDQEVLDEGPPEGHNDQYWDQRFGDMFGVLTDAKTRQAINRLTAMHESAYQKDRQCVTYKEDGHRTKNVMMALQEDCHNQTISPDWTMMQEASRGQGEKEDQDDLTTGGGGQFGPVREKGDHSKSKLPLTGQIVFPIRLLASISKICPALDNNRARFGNRRF
jgi:hypothetical protein